MDVGVLVAGTGATISALSLYFGLKARRLPSTREIRKEIEERLDGMHEIPTPLAARRHEEIKWNGNFHISVENVKVSELESRRKWLPSRGFTGNTLLELEFHGRDAPSEKSLYDSFLGKHVLFGTINRHIDDHSRMKIWVNSADPDIVCGHIFGTFRRVIMEIEFKKDNPEVDEDWLTHHHNTIFGYKDGDMYDILNERVALHLIHQSDQKPPDNIPPQPTAAKE